MGSGGERERKKESAREKDIGRGRDKERSSGREKRSCSHATRLHAYIHARATEESIAASHFHEKSGDRDDVVAGGVATSRRLRGRAIARVVTVEA